MAKRSVTNVVTVVDPNAELMAAVPELLATQDDSITIRQWMAGLIPFFTEARALEVKAKARLASAKLLRTPTNGEEDTAHQLFIRETSAENKVVKEHWKVTSLVYNFQRRLVSARDRAVDANEQAAKIAQDQHNEYAATERRRVDEENRRRQKEADDKARADREAEAKRLEEQALAAESNSPELSAREKAFVELIVAGVVPSQAAHRAGYKDTTRGVKMLESKKIFLAIAAAREAAALRRQAEAKKDEPIAPVEIQREVADLGTGGSDRTTKTAEITNARLFVEAVLGGQHAIPADCLMPDPVKLNQYARSLGEVINRWPGVRLKKGTTTV